MISRVILSNKYLSLGLSFFVVAWGQPARSSGLGLVAAAVGYALFWVLLIDEPSARRRFWQGCGWMFCVQLVQLSWMTSHEYQGYYIFGLLACLCLGMGLQFGLLCRLLSRGALSSLPRMLSLTGLWVLLEWSRLHLLTGLSFNPAGIALTGSLYSLQLTSWVGVYGLSFLVIFTNLLVLRALCLGNGKRLALIFILGPHVFGAYTFHHRADAMQSENAATLRAVLVQTAREPRVFLAANGPSYQELSYEIWDSTLDLLRPHYGKDVDILVLPEGFVFYSALEPVYPIEAVRAAFARTFGVEALRCLPAEREPLAKSYVVDGLRRSFVSNAYWAQGLSNLFAADLILGLDDRDLGSEGEVEHYNAAMYFQPNSTSIDRYEKQLLLPMAEYIPFDWCRDLAARYGIYGSFTAGKEAKVFSGDKVPPLGVSICYEETFGSLIRNARLKGAELLVNLTNDVWYPNSSLPEQHYAHARLRAVENGVPLLRACNTGITAGVDSLGREVDRVGKPGQDAEWIAEARLIELSTYSYSTIYSSLGDSLVLILAALCLALPSLLPKSN